MLKDNNDIYLAIENYNKNKIEILNLSPTIKELYDILLDNRIIKFNKKGSIVKRNPGKIIVGTLKIKGKFGFVISDLDVYIKDTSNYFEGDKVVVIIEETNKGKSIEGRILGYIERNEKLIVVKVKKDKKLIVLSEEFTNYSIELEDDNEKNLVDEKQIIQLKVINVKKRILICKFYNIVAEATDPDLKMKIVLANYGIDTEFSKETLEELERIEKINKEEIKNRIDLRQELVMTIDGEDAKDLDDAIHMIVEKNGYRLTVSIADVSYYIEDDTAINLDAYKRSTSVYFVDRVVPMIPKKLSNGLCSLHPNVDRLTISCEMLIDFEGNVIESKIFPSIINSKFRLTYDEVNEIIMKNKVSKEKEIIYSILKEMDKLRKILNKKRLLRGAFNLEDKDAKFIIDENGDIIDIKPFKRQNSEKLIEEFMIVANETVANTIFWMELPFLYRVHDEPNHKKMKEAFTMISSLGIKIKNEKAEFHPSMFKQVLDQIDDPLNRRIVSELIVRALSKARYQQKNIGHFGLASKSYTHFTSPIRRYPDLIVHRKIREYLFENKLSYSHKDIEKLEGISIHTSNKEVNATKAEQKIEDMKKASYMKKYLGKRFKANVAAVLDYGFFLELENTVRGLVKFERIKEFVSSKNYKIVFSNKKTLTIGDEVTVKIIEVNEEKGLVEFDLIGFTMLKQRRYEKKNYRPSNKEAYIRGKTIKPDRSKRKIKNQKLTKPTRRK